MFTRIMCCRGDEADLRNLLEVITFDHNLIGLDNTFLITPNKERLIYALGHRNDFSIISDDEVIKKYPKLANLRNRTKGWYFQQILKWCALDMLQVERSLIQDSDSYLNVAYDPYADNEFNFICKPGQKSPDKMGKAETYAELLHRYPVVIRNCITEFCPYSNVCWNSLKTRIENIHGIDWIEAISTIIKSDWKYSEGFYEYHIMVNHAVHEKFLHKFIPMEFIEVDSQISVADKEIYDRVVFKPTIDWDDDVLV